MTSMQRRTSGRTASGRRSRAPAMIVSTRWRVAADTSDRPLMTFETVGSTRRPRPRSGRSSSAVRPAPGRSVATFASVQCSESFGAQCNRSPALIDVKVRVRSRPRSSRNDIWTAIRTKLSSPRWVRGRQQPGDPHCDRRRARPGGDRVEATSDGARRLQRRSVSSACTSAGRRAAQQRPSAAQSAAPASAGRGAVRGREARSRSSVVAHHHRRPRQAVFQGIADAYTAAPERHDQHHRPRERGVQDQARDLDAVRRRARPVPVVGRRHHGGPGRRRRAQGHHRRHRVRGRTPSTPGALEHLRLQGQAVRRPVGHGHDRRLVQQGAVHARPASRAPPTTWADFLADVTKLKAAGIVPLAIAGKDDVAVHAPVDVPRCCASAAATLCTQMIQSGNWNTDACTQAGDAGPQAQRAQPVPARLQGRRPTTTRPPRSATARRPWKSWASGPPPSRTDRAPASKGIGDRPRLVPLPDGRRRRRARRPTASAAATASRSARMPRPRRSTS